MIERNDNIKLKMQKLHYSLREEFREKYDRNLPFCDEIFDRWERSKYLGFGEGTRIYDSCYVFGDVKVGRDCFIGQYCILDGTGGLEIGNYCEIASGTCIMTHDTVNRCLTGGKLPIEHSPVKIGNCCYIGPQCVISRGVNIGSHSIIGAQSLVNHEIPPYSIVYGTPARIVGEITITEEGKVERNIFNLCKGMD